MSLREAVTSKRRTARKTRLPGPGDLPELLFSEPLTLDDSHDVVTTIIGQAHSWLDIDGLSVYRFDPSGGRASCYTCKGVSPAYIADAEGGDEEISRAWATMIRRWSAIRDVREVPGAERLRGRLASEGMLSILVVPFQSGDGPSGALVLHRHTPHHWSRSELALGNALAWCVALAFENQQMSQTAGKAVQTKDRLLSRVSHELRTPLTSIIAYLQYLERHLADKPGSDFEMRQLKVVEAQALQLARLVQCILDVETLQGEGIGLRKEPLDLRELLRDAVSQVEPIATSHAFKVVLPAEFPEVSGDRSRLRQVIDNLVINAVKYSPDGGDVTVRLASRDGYALVAVEDHGIGVKEQHLPLVFDRFCHVESDSRSRRFGGVGIGLYTSKAVIEAHGGRIGVESREGEGSTFWFTLPLTPSEGEQVNSLSDSLGQSSNYSRSD